MDSLSFRIPEQHPADENTFDTRPAAVARWVEELPLGNTGEAARRIFRVIKEVNSLIVPLSERLELLESLAVPLDNILDQLERHYTGSHFPMPPKTQRVAEFTNQLLTEVVIAYQAVLESEEQSNWLFRMSHSSYWALCVHRLLHYLGRILSNYRVLHRPYPAGVWLAVHRLYQEADKHGKTSTRVTAPWQGEHRESVADIYKRLLLLSLVEPQLFTRPQLIEVYRDMPVWTDKTRLLAADKWKEEMESYCIRLDEDTPHTHQAEACHGDRESRANALILDISRLGHQLDELLETETEGEHVPVPGTQNRLSRDTLETLRQCWRVPRGEREVRYKTDKPVEVALGLSAVFSLMRAERKRHHDGITDQCLSDDLEPLLPGTKTRTRAVEPSSPAGVWDTIFYGTEIMQNSWAMTGEEKNYDFISARELDYNERGHCLEFHRDALQALDVGELIGFRNAGDEKLQLCVVRWIQEQDKGVLVGLMRLASEMEPLLVVMEHEQKDMALGCLLGIGEDSRPQLFLPHLQAIRERPLNMVVEKRLIPIVLHDRVSMSPLFDGYHFSVTQQLNVESLDGEMNLEQTNGLLHAIAHYNEGPGAHRAPDDFSDLWDSL